MSRARPVGNGGSGPIIRAGTRFETNETAWALLAASTSPRRGIPTDPRCCGIRKWVPRSGVSTQQSIGEDSQQLVELAEQQAAGLEQTDNDEDA